MNRRVTALVHAAIIAFGAARAFAQLQQGDDVAVIGDSITEQKIYSMFIEDYLVMCQPAGELRQTQFGWSGETSWGFESRMANDMLRFHATVATTCFGMNDGGYSPMTPQKEEHYRTSQTKIVEQLKKAGVHFIVVGSPGCVDLKTFRGGNHDLAVMYDKTLAALRDIAKEVAEKEGVTYADVYDPMYDVMTRSEAKYGGNYHLAGGDGVHPEANGHLVMAYAFLKALGCKGDIGSITVDLAGKKADATEGHKILSDKDGTIEIESSRYPFCFYGEDNARTDSTRGVLEFLPFNQDLNRLTLTVTGVSADKVNVTWGKNRKQFAAAELAKGINLAAEFLDNPFSEPFIRVQAQIRAKQEWETPLVKSVIHQIPAVDPAGRPELEEAVGKSIAAEESLSKAITASVVPVRHTIKIEPVQ